MKNDHSAPRPATDAMTLGLEVIRFLSQTAEACSLFVLEQGHDVDLVKVAVHCSDRAEHVAQYFLEAPDKRWPLDSALDDLAWLTEIDNLVNRARVKVQRHIPTLVDLEELSRRIRAKLAADTAPEPMESRSAESPATEATQDDYAGPLYRSVVVLGKNAGKPYELDAAGRLVGHTLIVGGHSNERGPMFHQTLSQLAFELQGRDFATLNELELQRFRLLRDQGRKIGLIASVEVMHSNDEIQAELAAASPAQQEEIHRRLQTQIALHWSVLDKT